MKSTESTDQHDFSPWLYDHRITVVFWMLYTAACSGTVGMIAPDVVTHPQSMNISLNGFAMFNCTAIASFITWEIDGVLIDSDLRGKGFDDSAPTLTLNLTQQLRSTSLRVLGSPDSNNVSITCLAIITITPFMNAINTSEPALMLVQGLLGSVSNLTVILINSTTVLISWSPPFTLEGIPILGYNVTISNTTSGENETMLVEDTTLLYSIDHPDPENNFTVTVVPINEVGAGNNTLSSFIIIATPTTPQATSSLMANTFTTSTQAFTATSISDLVNGTVHPSHLPPSSKPRIVAVIVISATCTCIVLVSISTCFCARYMIRRKNRIPHDGRLLSSTPPPPALCIPSSTPPPPSTPFMPSSTPLPPPSTPLPPPSTPLPPSSTPPPPPSTPLPPSSTPPPPSTLFMPSSTHLPPSSTPLPPSSTPPPPSTLFIPSSTPLPPSSTPLPPSSTPLPPSSTPPPPSSTPLPPSSTPLPPSSTVLLSFDESLPPSFVTPSPPPVARLSSTSIKLSTPILLEILRDEIANCTELGIHLKIELSTLKRLERQSKTRKTDKECFTEMCKYWLNNSKKRTWSVVYTAFNQVRNKTLEHLKYDEDSTVNLSVESFTKELEDVERDWYIFGFALGIPVKTLEEIEDKDGMRCYMLAMLNEWLGTGEATWEQLQVALVRTGNVRLSESLEKYIGEQEQQQQEPEFVNTSSFPFPIQEEDTENTDNSSEFIQMAVQQSQAKMKQKTQVLVVGNSFPVHAPDKRTYPFGPKIELSPTYKSLKKGSRLDDYFFCFIKT